MNTKVFVYSVSAADGPTLVKAKGKSIMDMTIYWQTAIMGEVPRLDDEIVINLEVGEE